MPWTFQVARFVGLGLAAGVASAARLNVPQNAEGSIRVRIYDYAQVSPATLSRAKAAASHVLEQAGVRLEWVECWLRQDAPPRDPACKLPLTPRDLHLRILDAGMAKRVHTSSDSLGYALLAEGSHWIAAVYFHRAIELGQRNLADPSVILGSMMAHEIGHLLLEQSGHSVSGIMRADWGDEDLKLIARGRMWFTADEKSRLISMVAK